MLKTELHTHEMPEVMSRFSELVGERHWTRRAVAIRSDAKGRPHLRDHLLQENEVALALDRVSAIRARYGSIPFQHLNDRQLYVGYKLAAQVVSLLDSGTVPQRPIVRRLHGAFNNPDDMRAIQFELGVATHFVRRGYAIAWPELEGTGTVDLTLKGLGPNGLEVECKSVSRDRGRKIHRHEAIDFHELVRRELEATANRLRVGLFVVLTIPDRLPKPYVEKKALAMQVRKVVIGGTSTVLSDGSDIRIGQFNMADYPHLGPPMSAQLRRDVDIITDTQNREVMLLGRRNAGALVFVVQSRRADPFFDHIFSSVDEATRKQLSKTRAGMVLVGLDGLSASELLSTAQQDQDPSEPPTALRVRVSEFLSGGGKEHLVGVGFLSRDEMEPSVNGHVSTGGIAYHFPKRDAQLWHDDFSGLFSGIQ